MNQSEHNPEEVDLIVRKSLLKGFFDVDLVTLRHRLHDGGWSDKMDRYLLYRPDGVSAIVHNTESETIYLARQFRPGAFEKEYGWLTELAAGLVDDGESHEDACRREIREELGFEVRELELLTKFFTSPGIITERVWIYYARVTEADRVGDGGGVDHEHENIDIIEVPVADLDQWLLQHPLRDAKTMIGMLIFREILRNRSED